MLNHFTYYIHFIYYTLCICRSLKGILFTKFYKKNTSRIQQTNISWYCSVIPFSSIMAFTHQNANRSTTAQYQRSTIIVTKYVSQFLYGYDPCAFSFLFFVVLANINLFFWIAHFALPIAFSFLLFDAFFAFRWYLWWLEMV